MPKNQLVNNFCIYFNSRDVGPIKIMYNFQKYIFAKAKEKWT